MRFWVKIVLAVLLFGALVLDASAASRQSVPKVSSVKVNGNNKTASWNAAVDFNVISGLTYRIYGYDEGGEEVMLTEGNLSADLIKETVDAWIDGLQNLASTKGRKTVYVQATNDTGTSKAAKVTVTPMLPKVSSVKVNGNNATWTNKVSMDLRMIYGGSCVVYGFDADGERVDIAEGYPDGEIEQWSSVHITEKSIAAVATINGKKTLYVEGVNDIGVGAAAKVQVTLLLPKVSSFNLSGMKITADYDYTLIKNKTGWNQVYADFRVDYGKTYRIYGFDENGNEVLVDNGRSYPDEKGREYFEEWEIYLDEIAAVKGKKTLFLEATNEFGTSTKPAKTVVTMEAPKISDARLNGEKSPLLLIESDAELTFGANWDVEYRWSFELFDKDASEEELSWEGYYIPGKVKVYDWYDEDVWWWEYDFIPVEVPESDFTLYVQARNDAGVSEVISCSGLTHMIWIGDAVMTGNTAYEAVGAEGPFASHYFVTYVRKQKDNEIELQIPCAKFLGNYEVSELEETEFQASYTDHQGKVHQLTGTISGGSFDATETVTFNGETATWSLDLGRSNGLRVPDIDGVWILDSQKSYGYSWGADYEAFDPAFYQPSFYRFFEITTDDNEITVVDLFSSQKFEGYLEGRCAFLKAEKKAEAETISFLFDNYGTKFIGCSEWASYGKNWGVEECEAFSASWYSAEADCPNEKVRCETYTRYDLSEEELDDEEGTGSYSIRGHSITVVVTIHGQKDTLKGKVYDGCFYASGKYTDLSGEVWDGFYASFIFDNGEIVLGGTIDAYAEEDDEGGRFMSW